MAIGDGFRQVVIGIQHTAIPCFDHAKFAQAIARVLNDSAECARLQDLGRTCASQYDWSVIAAADSAAL